MSKENISLSSLLEEVVSEFVLRKPGLRASFEIENNVIVCGDYKLWREALQSLIENSIRACIHSRRPSIAFGRMEDEGVYVVMDDGKQFNFSPDDTILTVLLHQSPGIINIKRITIKQGGNVVGSDYTDVDGVFYFSFN